MPQKKPVNPFYVILLPVGAIFALTACAFVVMTLRALEPQPMEETGMVVVMQRHGVMIMTVELAVLGILTVAAIASDGFWVRRFEAAQASATDVVEQSP
jgi:hypothetical protein